MLGGWEYDRGVDGLPVHASIVGSEIIRRDIGADNHRRVGGRAAHPTMSAPVARHANVTTLFRPPALAWYSAASAAATNSCATPSIA